MKFVFPILCMILISTGCAKPSASNTDTNSPKGSRDFKLEAGQPGILVNLYGVDMGTPDRPAVWSIIQDAQNRGWVTRLVELPQPIEGGLNHCLEIPDANSRATTLVNLQNVATSAANSHYFVTSVPDCN